MIVVIYEKKVHASRGKLRRFKINAQFLANEVKRLRSKCNLNFSIPLNNELYKLLFFIYRKILNRRIYIRETKRLNRQMFVK